MGKIHQKRLKFSRYCPTNKTHQKHENDKPLEQLLQEVTVTKFPTGLKAVLDKINNGESQEKVTGLNTLAGFALEKESVSLILKQNLVKKIVSYLEDTNSQVQLAAIGALRYCPTNKTHQKHENDKPLEQLLQEVTVTKFPTGLEAVLDKINNGESQEKVTGLNTLAGFALEKESVSLILKQNLVKKIVSYLEDTNSQVQLAAIGALRNICSWGGEENNEIIEVIIQQDVLHSLSKLIRSYEKKDSIFGVSSKKSQSSKNYSKGIANSMVDSDSYNLIFIHAVNIMWSLCEWTEEAVEEFNRESLINIILKYIDFNLWGFDVSLACADCLFCVSENNEKAASKILPQVDNILKHIRDSLDVRSSHSLRYTVVLSGVLLNVAFWSGDNSESCEVLQVLSKVLEVNPLDYEKSTKEEFNEVISSQIIALEILCNLCCPDDEYYSDEDDSSDSQSFDAGTDMQMDEDCRNRDFLCPQIMEGIIHYDLLAKINDKLNIDLNSSHNNKEKTTQLKIRALQCLQTLIFSLNVSQLGGARKVNHDWMVCFTNMFLKHFSEQEKNNELQDAIAGALRSSVEKYCQSDPTERPIISSEQLQSIFSIMSSENDTSETTRANVCRIICSFACCVVRQSDFPCDNSSQRICEISSFLLQLVEKEPILWVQSEALDCLIDIFSDDKTDFIASRVRLVSRLKIIHPQFKTKYKQQKRTLGDHRPLVCTVKQNLSAFIKYKNQRISEQK